MLKVFLMLIGFVQVEPLPPPVIVIPYVEPTVCIGIEMPLHCMMAPWHNEDTQEYCA